MSNDLMLLNEYDFLGFEIDLNESNLNKGTLKFKGKLQEAETVNKNKRRYPFCVLDENVKRLVEVVKGRGLVGELDHPADSIIHFKEASHLLTKLWWEGNVLMGEGEILSTAHGRQLKELLNSGVRVGMSSRGVGNGKVDADGVLVIGESYKLITFDAVADPSTFAAFQKVSAGGKQESINHYNSYNSQNYEPKNDSSRIYNFNKDVLIAAIGGVVKERTNKIKERLS